MKTILIITMYIRTLSIYQCLTASREFNWRRLGCSVDQEPVQTGLLPPEQIGRFPWLGVIHYDFYAAAAGTSRYSITGAVLIHPGYALASAEDMAKIDKSILRNSTQFILWRNAVSKYNIGIEDYTLHPEYEGLTYATSALVTLVRDGNIELGDPGPIMQVCMPLKGGGSFGNTYAIKVTDIFGEFQKEVTHVDIVDVKDCDLNNDKAEPEQKMLEPTYPICTSPQSLEPVCFMESGSVLVSRESGLYWTLLGFGVRGLSCTAPARYIYIMSHMEWIESLIPL